ncbi:efflux RND transporter permease subunit [Sulfurovum sp. zt1-1]|uniref:Efflux RND transporter permease subunit n=1 Tax=Sulfurovum zhangzhouensis TaxID=3019067 RepID=A0ABT7QYV0_9BACT|nr:efflux RND transporter permease subunit [Sulfurovum zhangzhouensis]MDM5272014.1 efflux RND transporter permease subunit [Sulfurovum zhangzhouensis]
MIRSFITFAIDRPIINHILLAFLLLLSIFSYQNIPKEIFPPSNLDQISITGGYPGASADVLDKMAVKNIEDELKSISEISNIDTIIQNGLFSIKADIKPGSDNQLVLSDVKDVIANIRRDLPTDMDEPIAKITVHNFPLLLVAISGDRPQKELLDIADEIKSRLSSFKELSDILIRGEADDEVLISIDEQKLIAYDLPKESVYRSIGALSSIFPIGTLEQKGNHLYISTINGEKSAKALEDTLITVNGKRVRVGDIAKVSFGLSDTVQISHFNGKRNVSLDISKTKDGNAIALSKEIKAMLSQMQKEYKDVTLEAYTDTSIWIKNRLNLVSSNIFFGLILVFMALFMSVNYKIALVVAVGIPASFMITLIGADQMGYSLNMLTLLGALIALGMLVDEAIVVAENIFRHMEMGKSARQAAIDGAVEMFPAVLTATMTTVFAFLPLLIMSGQMGMFMKVLPVMISILLLSSLFEAFYFLPLHSKEFFTMRDADKEHSRNDFWIKMDKAYASILGALLYTKKNSVLTTAFERLKTKQSVLKASLPRLVEENTYRILYKILKPFTQRKVFSLFSLVGAILLMTVLMMNITKFQLFPEFDTTQLYLNGKVDVNNKLEDTEEIVAKIEKELLQYYDAEETSSITSVVGFYMNSDQTFETGSNLFHIFINLHEKAPENFIDTFINPIFSLEYDGSDMIRKRKAQQIALATQKDVVDALRELKATNGQKLFSQINLYVPQTGIVGHDIEIGLSSKDEDKKLEALAELKKELGKIDGVFDIADDAKEGVRELKLRINEYGQMLGFTETYVTSELKGLFLKAEYGKMFNDTGLVRLRIEDPRKDQYLQIGSVTLTTPDGQNVVKLSEICDFNYQKSFVKIYKEDGQRVSTVTARVDSKKVLATEVMKKINPMLEMFEKEGLKVIIKGEEKENKQMKREMSQAALIAIFLIFISLVWMFNSLILPLIIISTIPLSILGALVGAYVMGINLTMPGVMGLIGLAGVVVNDGIIMLDFIKGSKNYAEMMEKAGHRLRPILLTSITTLLGLSSLIFFASGQALIIQPMAISLGFGVAWATVLNLYYVPLMYAVIYKVQSDS